MSSRAPGTNGTVGVYESARDAAADDLDAPGPDTDPSGGGDVDEIASSMYAGPWENTRWWWYEFKERPQYG
jgi:hypothetical protein